MDSKYKKQFVQRTKPGRMKPSQFHNNSSNVPALDLLSEQVPGDGCFGHIPCLPGLCFRGESQADLEQIAPDQINKYTDWLVSVGLADLNPSVITMTNPLRGSPYGSLSVIKKEIVVGSPVWISGNPAALFNYDLQPLEDGAILSHLRFTRQVLKRIEEIAETIPEAKRQHKLDQEHRSINEMLTHIGNCVWWYCSRIDDDLLEPDELSAETPLQRVVRLYEDAEKYLTSVPLPQRSIIHIPTRFLTNDPSEKWTHTKVCRREAEHAWEHLSEIMQIVG